VSGDGAVSGAGAGAGALATAAAGAWRAVVSAAASGDSAIFGVAREGLERDGGGEMEGEGVGVSPFPRLTRRRRPARQMKALVDERRRKRRRMRRKRKDDETHPCRYIFVG